MSNLISSFESYCAETQAAVDEALEKELSKPKIGGGGVLAEAIRYAVLSKGKRIRPLLTLSVVQVLGGDAQRALPAAMAAEFIHSASLILDDLPCMDNAELRRFRKTHHRVFGEDLTVLTALSLMNSAYSLLNSYADGEAAAPALACRLVACLNEAIGTVGLIGGQVDDLRSKDVVVDFNGVTNVYERKTASLFTFAVEAGALIAGATTEEYQCLEAYARNLGLAFQLYDDVMDQLGDPCIMGKDVLQDLDKQTFLTLAPSAISHRAVRDLIVFAVAQIAPFGDRARMLAALPWTICGTALFKGSLIPKDENRSYVKSLQYSG